MAQKYVLGPNAAREFKRLMHKSPGVSRRDGAAGALAFDAEYVHPFAVQWAASANSGDGAWIIWLPSAALVTADGETYDMTTDLEAAGGDYPSGWYVLTDEMLEASSGGTLYLNVEKVTDEETDEESVEASFSAEESEETDAYSVAICEASVDSTTGERAVKAFVTSALVIGGKFVKSLTGDSEASERISGDVEITGQLAPGEPTTSCGIVVTTVGAREAVGDDPARGPRLILDLKDRDPQEENWGVHEIKFTDTTGANKIAHVLSCEDIEIGGGSGGGSGGGGQAITNVIGSDYIDVTDKTENDVAKRQVKAKILTGVGSETADAHALLTHDTEQKVVAKKLFQNAAGTKVVAVDGPNGSIILTDTGSGASITLNPSAIPAACSGKNIAAHEFKFRDAQGNTHKYHGLFCGDIDLTTIGKVIRSTEIVPTANGNSIVFTYTDGSSDTFVIQNGLPGTPGTDGQDGDTPVISAIRSGRVVTILADGAAIATLTDATAPNITAQKVGKVTTIYADGQAIASINDGEDAEEGHDEWVRQSVVTGLKFQTSGGKLQAVLSKADIWVPNWSGKVPVEYEDVQTIDVCDVSEIDVVTSESYSTSTHQFTNTRKKVKVIGTPTDAVGQTPFTATALSGE